MLELYALILVGYLIGLRYSIEKQLSNILIYILLPLLVLQVISVNFMPFLKLLPIAYLATFLGIAASYAYASILIRGEDIISRVTYKLTAVRWNALFLPLAMAIALGLPDEAMLLIFGFSLAFNTLYPIITPFIVLEASSKKAKKSLKLPILWAALIAIILGMLDKPVMLPGYHFLKLSVSYLSLIYVGLRLSKSTKIERDVIYVGLIRFFLVPISVYPLLLLVLGSLSRPYNYVLIIELSSAPAVSNVVYAYYFELDPIKASKAVAYLNAIGVAIDYIYRIILA